jgi:hypothetical protein
VAIDAREYGGSMAGRRLVLLGAIALAGSVALSAAWTTTAGTQGNRATGCSLKWRTLKSAIPRGGFTFLRDVVALSKTDAWTVGEHDSPDFEVSRTLIERWDGHRWRVTPSPNVGSKEDALYGVAAISGTDAWAVGETTIFDDPVIVNKSRTLIEHWDGERWSVVPGADVQARASGLYSVIAVGTHDVWAAGGSSGDRGWQPLIEHWDGRSWALVPSALRGGVLTGLAQFPLAQSPGVDLFAVGSYDAQFRDVMQHWDGLKWTVAPGAPIKGHLADVGGSSGNNLWAVGEFGAGVSARPLVAHWNGIKWSVSHIPFSHLKPRHDGGLNGVFAVSPTNVWAVGFGIEHWNGKGWALVELEKREDFAAIGGSAARDIWAVGQRVKHYSCK